MVPMGAMAEHDALAAVAIDDLDRRFADARPALVRLCASLVGVDDSDDVVQDVYIVARRRIGQLHDPSALEGWLKRIAVNRCYDRHRRTKRLAERLPLLHRSHHRAHGERDLGLLELVEQLPQRQRTVLVLYYAYGYGLHEIAELLSLTHVNVRSIIARARRSLLETWQEADR
jgi:RNA polymerase sigma-70 factor (ECF subfamily)